RISDRGGAPSANLFRWRQIAQIRPMSFPGMDHLKTSGTPDGKQSSIRVDGAAQLRNVVPQHFAESARLQEISLHIDDKKSAMFRLEFEVVRLGLDAQRSIAVH